MVLYSFYHHASGFFWLLSLVSLLLIEADGDTRHFVVEDQVVPRQLTHVRFATRHLSGKEKGTQDPDKRDLCVLRRYKGPPRRKQKTTKRESGAQSYELRKQRTKTNFCGHR